MNKTVLYTGQQAKPAKLFTLTERGFVEETLITFPCVIGRDNTNSKSNIRLNCKTASRAHGEIKVIDGEYYYHDLNSKNGTFINDVLYGRNAKLSTARLENGDVLRIGTKTAGYPDSIVIIFSTDYFETDEWVHPRLNDNVAEINIGRAIGNNGLLLGNDSVSKNHASFIRSGADWAISDHESTNGVFVNNRRITAAVELQYLDVVRIVNTHFIYVDNCLLYQKNKECKSEGEKADQKANKLVIRIAERSAWQKFKKLTLLQNINLTVDCGEMVLILGSSGAGKTTFMNAVMGYEKADGQIFHGETDVYNEYEQMKYEIGFVPQQDLLRGSDSVIDTLSNAADMKLPRKSTPEQKMAGIEEMLELFGLQRERNSLASKLSGGQRKRLSIAVEFISNPSLFFLDEPDSGLDGIMAKSLHENLRTIADSGKIIMVITHSPDRVAYLYDKVIVLAKSVADNCGHLAFYGSVRGALDFFDMDSLEGVVKRINRPDEGGDGKSDYYIEKYEKLMG